ncbi:hypothetical protein LP415_18275 [Polaromonas sp. P1(28)-8]|nr:hypothetical protein LP415_18275 [Polaromonas sp. P1(28)-8]
MHELYEHRHLLGFVLLDKEGLRHLARALPESKNHEQRAYIPPRIWSYQVTQLKRCLDDYLKHQEQIENCYQFCLDAYAHNAGTLEKAVSVGLESGKYGPFHTQNFDIKKGKALSFMGRLKSPRLFLAYTNYWSDGLAHLTTGGASPVFAG